MLFALIADDKPEGLAARMAVRPEHLKHLEALGDKLKLAGPFLDQQGNMVGSIVLSVFMNLSTLVLPENLKYAAALVVLILILLFRPQGILGRRERVG